MPILQMKKLRTAVTEGLAQGHADASTLHRHSWSARSPQLRSHALYHLLCVRLTA